jgi:Mn-dependent DtxR family transcriptional regulator
MKAKSTPDERFMVKLYETAMSGGDPHAMIDYRGVAKAIGQKETAIKNIIKHLAQANFLKKADDTTVYLTERGCTFVLDLMNLSH